MYDTGQTYDTGSSFRTGDAEFNDADIYEAIDEAFRQLNKSLEYYRRSAIKEKVVCGILLTIGIIISLATFFADEKIFMWWTIPPGLIKLNHAYKSDSNIKEAERDFWQQVYDQTGWTEKDFKNGAKQSNAKRNEKLCRICDFKLSDDHMYCPKCGNKR